MHRMLQSQTLAATLPTTLSTWWTILRICLEERLVYRGDFALGTLMRFLPIVTQIFLWAADLRRRPATAHDRRLHAATTSSPITC